MGKNMRHALAFARKYPGWHTFDLKCRATRNAVQSLARLGMVQIHDVYNDMFKLAQ